MLPTGMFSALDASFLVSVGGTRLLPLGTILFLLGEHVQDGTLSSQFSLNKEIPPLSERQVAIQPFLPPHIETLERDANIRIRARTMYVFPIFCCYWGQQIQC
jgi:hypothetical protein